MTKSLLSMVSKTAVSLFRRIFGSRMLAFVQQKREEDVRPIPQPAEESSFDLELNRQRVRRFHGKHVGERCFIVGNGPSLNRTDLSLLKNEITFGMNRVYLLFPKLGFETTYFVSVNALVIEQCASEMESLKMPKFLSMAGRSHLPFDDRIMFMKSIGGAPRFSEDVSEIVWESGTVTYVALQLAYYMGFQKVILVGVDHNFTTKGPANQAVVSQGNDPNHFAADYFGKGFRWQLPDLYHSEMGYRLARDTYTAAGREILDATVDGKLDIFPKVKLENLFSPGGAEPVK